MIWVEELKLEEYGIAILWILANKQDCDGALDELDIVEKLDLERLVNQQRCPTMVETCSATIMKNTKRKLDPAIQNGYKWLVNCIIHNYASLNDRVLSDMAEQKLAEDIERRERLKRYINSKERNDVGDDEEMNADEVNIDPFRPISETLRNRAKNLIENIDLSNDMAYDERRREINTIGNDGYNRKPSCPSVATDLIKEQLELEKNNKKSRFLWRSNKTGPAPFTSTDSEIEPVRENSDPESGGQDSGFASPPKHLPPLEISKNIRANSAPWVHVPLSSTSETSISPDGAWDLHKAFEVVPVTEISETDNRVKDNLHLT